MDGNEVEEMGVNERERTSGNSSRGTCEFSGQVTIPPSDMVEHTHHHILQTRGFPL